MMSTNKVKPVVPGRGAAVCVLEYPGAPTYIRANGVDPKSFCFTKELDEATVWDPDAPNTDDATTFCAAMTSVKAHLIALSLVQRPRRAEACEDIRRAKRFADLPKGRTLTEAVEEAAVYAHQAGAVLQA
jgi:hypothetical protein